MEIFKLLLDRDAYIEVISERLKLSPSTVSFHMKKLYDARLVTSRREQYYTIYSAVPSIAELRIKDIRSYLLCRDGVKVVGWSFGFQKDAEEFYMTNSAVIPEYRKMGIYKTLLSMMVEKAKNYGFQIVSSNHHASNNAILIPKLKLGFKIVGMKLNPRFGTLIELHYYTNHKVSKILDYRTGYSKDLP